MTASTNAQVGNVGKQLFFLRSFSRVLPGTRQSLTSSFRTVYLGVMPIVKVVSRVATSATRGANGTRNLPPATTFTRGFCVWKAWTAKAERVEGGTCQVKTLADGKLD